MKKLIAILSIAAIAATAHAQTWTMPNLAYFNTNVFLHDAPTVPLHTRYIKASGESRAITLGGVFTVTNKTVFGAANSANGSYATVSGGWLNSAAGLYSGVAGGQVNTAAGNYSFVAGGFGNITTGSFTFAGGRRASATNEGSFVWGDSVDAEKGSAGDNTFNVYASGGFYLNGVKGLSVTQTFLDASSGVRTNIYINGILTTGYTE